MFLVLFFHFRYELFALGDDFETLCISAFQMSFKSTDLAVFFSFPAVAVVPPKHVSSLKLLHKQAVQSASVLR